MAASELISSWLKVDHAFIVAPRSASALKFCAAPADSSLMDLYIGNVRLGHATNSSSSHSLIFMRRRENVSDDLASYDDSYGWENFVLASRSAKAGYAAALIASTGVLDKLAKLYGDEDKAVRFVSELTGHDVKLEYRSWTDKDGKEHFYTDASPTIDHQSVPTLAFASGDRWNADDELLKVIERNADKVTAADYEQLIAGLTELILDDDVVIAGGNDNDDYTPEPTNPSTSEYYSMGSFTIRKTPNGWLMFNRWSGAKLRLVDRDGDLRPTAPELVDIKTTDYCPYGCSFCYQGSTEKGEHGSLENIQVIAERLAEAGVLEVAIGGGEPTLHPDFVETLKAFSSRGINANFTTRNLAWIRKEELRAEVRKHSQAFAYSVEDPANVAKLRALMTDNRFYMEANLHYVMGSTDFDTFKAIVDAAYEHRFRLTLLGYKTTGRGDEFTPHDYSGWLDHLTSLDTPAGKLGLPGRLPDVSVDTTLVQQTYDQMVEKLPAATFHREEGLFSAYVDAVSMTMAPSSYEPDRGHSPFDENWLATFREWPAHLSHELRVRGQDRDDY